jgi:hypothetical protein
MSARLSTHARLTTAIRECLVRAGCNGTFSSATGHVCTVAVNARCQDVLPLVPNRHGQRTVSANRNGRLGCTFGSPTWDRVRPGAAFRPRLHRPSERRRRTCMAAIRPPPPSRLHKNCIGVLRRVDQLLTRCWQLPGETQIIRLRNPAAGLVQRIQNRLPAHGTAVLRPKVGASGGALFSPVGRSRLPFGFSSLR